MEIQMWGGVLHIYSSWQVEQNNGYWAKHWQLIQYAFLFMCLGNGSHEYGVVRGEGGHLFLWNQCGKKSKHITIYFYAQPVA